MKQNKQKILLIQPPFYRLYKDTYSLDLFPLSLGYLSGAIRKDTDWEVLAYNSDFNPDSEGVSQSYLSGKGFDNYLGNLNDISKPIWQEIRKNIEEYKPCVVGISVKSQTFASACRVAKLAKDINNDCIVIVGGPHPSMVGSEVLNCSDINVFVKGEGEKPTVELLNAIKDGKEFDGIRGIGYRKNGRIIDNPARELIEDLDSLSFPHEVAPAVLKDYEKYPLSAFKNIFSIRGCPYNCFFCGSRMVWSRKVRFRSVENVIAEIQSLQYMGIELIRFDDDTFGVTKKYIKELCHALIKHCPGLKWHCEIHVKLVDEPTISLMKAAGCCLLQIGVESGNNEILKEMRKNYTIEEALSACEIIKKYGIELQTFFIVGFPQETEDSFNDTYKAMKKIKSDLIIHSIFTPYPGTESFELCKKNGLIKDGHDISLYNHQSPANCFCMNITSERFRILVSQIQKMIDRKSRLDRARRVLSLSTIKKIKELGLRKSYQKFQNLIFGN